MADAALKRDPSGGIAVGVTGDTSEDLIPQKGDEDAYTAHVSLWVWDSTELEWVKMTQPIVEITGDLEVNTDDLEQHIVDQMQNYFLSDWTIISNVAYMGYLTKGGAWMIKKIDITNGQVRYVSGSSSYSFADPASLSYDTFDTEF